MCWIAYGAEVVVPDWRSRRTIRHSYQCVGPVGPVIDGAWKPDQHANPDRQAIM